MTVTLCHDAQCNPALVCFCVRDARYEPRTSNGLMEAPRLEQESYSCAVEAFPEENETSVA